MRDYFSAPQSKDLSVARRCCRIGRIISAQRLRWTDRVMFRKK